MASLDEDQKVSTEAGPLTLQGAPAAAPHKGVPVEKTADFPREDVTTPASTSNSAQNSFSSDAREETSTSEGCSNLSVNKDCENRIEDKDRENCLGDKDCENRLEDHENVSRQQQQHHHLSGSATHPSAASWTTDSTDPPTTTPAAPTSDSKSFPPFSTQGVLQSDSCAEAGEHVSGVAAVWRDAVEGATVPSPTTAVSDCCEVSSLQNTDQQQPLQNVPDSTVGSSTLRDAEMLPSGETSYQEHQEDQRKGMVPSADFHDPAEQTSAFEGPPAAIFSAPPATDSTAASLHHQHLRGWHPGTGAAMPMSALAQHHQLAAGAPHQHRQHHAAPPFPPSFREAFNAPVAGPLMYGHREAMRGGCAVASHIDPHARHQPHRVRHHLHYHQHHYSLQPHHRHGGMNFAPALVQQQKCAAHPYPMPQSATPMISTNEFHNEVHLQFRGVGTTMSKLKVKTADQTQMRSFVGMPHTINTNVSGLQCGNLEVSVFSDIGGRKFQEDRFTFAPQLIEGRHDAMFLGVFDGTVGDFASENVKDLVVPALCRSQAWQRVETFLSAAGRKPGEEIKSSGLTGATSEASHANGSVSCADSTAPNVSCEEGENSGEGKIGARLSDSSKRAGENDRGESENVEMREANSDECKGDLGNGAASSKVECGEVAVTAMGCGGKEGSGVIAAEGSGKTLESSGGPEGDKYVFQQQRGGGGNENHEDEDEFFSDCHLSSGSEGDAAEEEQPDQKAEEVPAATEAEIPHLLIQSMAHMYLKSDAELVALCAKESKHYASSTSITAILAGGYCCVGHLGDSRAALGFLSHNNQVHADFLTIDHKPDLQHEHDRIVASGGSVEYLHNHENKPFIRGGDFTERKAKGEQAMQLQYSRAFGGKDLKMFGLSNEPDLRCFKLNPRSHVCLILASDGLWDIYTAQDAVDIAISSQNHGKDPAEMLVRATVNLQAERQAKSDNVTAMVVFFR